MDLKKEVNYDATLEIREKTMRYDDTVIQLKNISKVSVSPIPKTPYPTWAFLCVFIGGFFAWQGYGSLKTFGIIALIVGIITLAVLYSKNSELGDYLMINLNSGINVIFSCKDKKFLKSVKDTIASSFDENENYSINLKDCQIINKSVVSSSQVGGSNNSQIS